MNKWITHVKKYAKKHNIGYNEALRSKKCQMEYRKTSPKGRKTSPKGRKTSPKGRKKMNGIIENLYKKLRRNQEKMDRDKIMRDLYEITGEVDRIKTEEEEEADLKLEKLKGAALEKNLKKDFYEDPKKYTRMKELLARSHEKEEGRLKDKCKQTVNTLISMMKNEGDNITNKSEGKDYITRKFTHLKTIKDLFSVNCSKFYTEDPDMKTENRDLENAYREYKEIYDRYKSN